MDKKLFADLVESMKQMNEIVQGKRSPSRRFEVNAISVKKLRSKLGLSQPEFAGPSARGRGDASQLGAGPT